MSEAMKRLLRLEDQARRATAMQATAALAADVGCTVADLQTDADRIARMIDAIGYAATVHTLADDLGITVTQLLADVEEVSR